MTLTEQWKKGELPKGVYWIKLNWDKEKIVEYDGLIFWANAQSYEEQTKEVLAKVPSYEEYQKLLRLRLQSYAIKWMF